MTVSIIIPCFNHAAFLAEAIESALAQEGAPAEVIVVNDGSTDGTAEVARRYRAVRLVEQENRGLSAARNAGLAVARGEVVIFLDADDRLRPNAAAAARAAFTRNSGAMMVIGRCELIDAASRPLPTHLPVVTAHFYRELLRRNYIWMPAMAAFRRDVFERVGPFDPSINASADYDIYLRVARCCPVAAHEAVVAEYRRHDGNMSGDPVLMLRTTLRVMRRHERFACLDRGLRDAYAEGMRSWRRFYGERLVQRFRQALHTPGGTGAALRDACRLLRWYPRGVAVQLARKARVSLRGAGDPGRRDRVRHLAGL